jgi:hypothetical protein
MIELHRCSIELDASIDNSMSFAQSQSSQNLFSFQQSTLNNSRPNSRQKLLHVPENKFNLFDAIRTSSPTNNNNTKNSSLSIDDSFLTPNDEIAKEEEPITSRTDDSGFTEQNSLFQPKNSDSISKYMSDLLREQDTNFERSPSSRNSDRNHGYIELKNISKVRS